MKYNPLEVSDAKAMEPYVVVPPNKTATSYNNPGLPKPPAGWGKVLPTTEEPMEDLYPDLHDSD